MQVVFIGGTGRSGSTLLERILEQDDRVFSAGELEGLLFRPDALGSLCGCGAAVASCEVWQAVLIRAFGSVAAFEQSGLQDLRRAVLRARHLPMLLSGVRPARYAQDIRALTGTLQRIYESIFAVTGAAYVVDASKAPAYADVLARTPDIDLRLIHLVRDARGVVYSSSKSGFYRPQTDEEMATFGTAFVAAGWSIEQALTAALPATRRTLLRYEDLMRRGSTELDDRLTRLGVGDIAVPRFIAGETLSLQPGHGLYGNPMRFEREVTLRADEEWRTRLPRRDRLTATAIASPLLARYRYLGRRPQAEVGRRRA